MMMNQHPSAPDYYPNSRGHYAYDQFGVASFSYRPTSAAATAVSPTLQLPLRPTAELGLPELHHHHHHHHHRPQEHHHVNHHQLLQQQQNHHQRPPLQQQQQRVQPQPQPHIQHNMSNWQTDEDLAEFQELSNKYEPEATVSELGVL